MAIKVSGKTLDESPIEAFATPLLEDFAAKFMPHLFNSPYGILKRELDNRRRQVREEIHNMHLSRNDPSLTSEEAQVTAVDTSLAYLRSLMDLRATNNPEVAQAETYLMQTRGIYISELYAKTLEVYEGFRRDLEAKLKLTANICIKILRVDMG
ncbi:MAG: hypothetical protein H0X02_09240, partial [Nitrosomonas sp.]|nr:hypothetical protein [Nitrosomonas sp.]